MALMLLAGSITTFARNATCVRMDLPFFPDERVAAAVNSLALRGRMLVWFDWGEYAIWHLAPQVSVSIDGRRETVYSDDVIRRHLRFYYVPDERRAVLDALRPDYIWLPSELPVTPKLVADGWMPLASGDRSMLLARGDAKVGMESFGVPPPPRCFPGP